MSERANDVLWVLLQRTKNNCQYFRPTTLARETGFTRAEVELALFVMRSWGEMECRRDGRWFRKRQEVAA